MTFKLLLSPSFLSRLAPVLALGGVACVVLIALSFAVTGSFVFESAPAAGEAEHVSPYFGGVVGAVLATGLISAWRLAEEIRRGRGV